MIKTKHINEFKIGQNIYGFYHTIFKEKKISKNGDKYIDVELRDKTGRINAKIWQFIEFYDQVFKEGDVVAVKGEIKRFRGNLFIEIRSISELVPKIYKKYGFKPDDIYSEINQSPQKIFNDLIKLINKLDNPYKKLVLKIYNFYEEEIKLFPDDIMSNQFNSRGGLVLKISKTLKTALKIVKNTNLDKSLIVSGILLKYIGRVIQYEYDIVFTFRSISKTENIYILSRDIIKNFSNDLKIKNNILNELVDIILFEKSHSNSENLIGSLVYDFFNIENTLNQIKFND